MSGEQNTWNNTYHKALGNIAIKNKNHICNLEKNGNMAWKLKSEEIKGKSRKNSHVEY